MVLGASWGVVKASPRQTTRKLVPRVVLAWTAPRNELTEILARRKNYQHGIGIDVCITTQTNRELQAKLVLRPYGVAHWETQMPQSRRANATVI